MKYISDFLRFLFPVRCAVCGKPLNSDEEAVCASCYANLPFTRLRGKKGNYVERLFWDLPVERASAFLKYAKGNATAEILYSLKYHHQIKPGIFLAEAMTEELMETDFFNGVDLIVPIPLHSNRRASRGYNQSEIVANTIGKMVGLPVDTQSVIRIVDNPSQTRKTLEERNRNVEGIFKVVNVEALKGKHCLLVDDVLTTGSTLRSMMQTIVEKVDNVKFSVIVLSLAGRLREVRQTVETEGTFVVDVVDDESFISTPILPTGT